MLYEISDDPKMLRETLCVAQARIGNSLYDKSRRDEHIQRLQRLINECDRHRPLGINGKHGNLHTETCGCLDKGDPSTWGTVTSLVHAWDGELTWCDIVIDEAFYKEGGTIARDFKAITCPVCQSRILREI